MKPQMKPFQISVRLIPHPFLLSHGSHGSQAYHI
jgi:hypothetical protein